MSRDPRRDPTPGDHLERGGVVRRVLEVGPDYVRFDLPGMVREAPKRVERGTWDRWAKRARPVAAPVEHRDLKPENVLPRDLDALRAVAACRADPDGWTEAGAAELRARVDLERRAWQGVVSRALAAGLLERRSAGARRGDRYRLTERGRMALAAGPHGAARGRTAGPHGDVLGSPLPPNPREEKNNERTNQPTNAGPHVDERGRMAGPHGAPTDLALVVMDRLAAAMERLADVLAVRALPPRPPAPRPAPPAPDEPERAPPSSDPRPVPDHPAPECCGSPRVLTNGPKGWFWGCVLWRSSGCRGLSLDEARAAWLEAQRAAEEQARQESMRAAREAREREDDERHRARVAELAEAARTRREAEAQEAAERLEQERSRRAGGRGLATVGAAVESLLGAARPT